MSMLLGLTVVNCLLVVASILGVFLPVREEKEDVPMPAPCECTTETIEWSPSEQAALIREDLGYVVSLYSSSGYVSGILCNSHTDKSSAFDMLSRTAQRNSHSEPGWHCSTMRLLPNGLCEQCDAFACGAVPAKHQDITAFQLCPCGPY